MSIYYFLCFFITFVVMMYHFIIWNRRSSLEITLILFFTTIANYGYWLLSGATRIDEALLANKVVYFGGCFSALFMMLHIMNFSKVSLGRFWKIFSYILHIVMFFGSLTAGYSGIFYKKAYLLWADGRYQFVKEYGPLHTGLNLMLISDSVIGIVAMLQAVRNSKRLGISRKSMVIMSVTQVIFVFAFFMEKALHVQLLAASYVLFHIGLTIFSRRLVLYNVDEMVMNSLLKKGDMGLVSFDLKYRYLGCNDIARNIYEPLQSLFVDGEMDEKDERFDQIRNWLRGFAEGQELREVYEKDGKYYKIMMQHLMDGNRIRGYNLIFMDITKDKEYENRLRMISITDELTQLRNRRAYSEQMEEMDKGVIPNNLAIVSFDVNGLKGANDTFGHAAGDELVKGAAECLGEAFSDMGTIFRIGGDEFSGILYCTEEELTKAFERLEQRCEQWQGERVRKLTISKGSAIYAEYPEASIEELERRADLCMYADKKLYYEKIGEVRR